MRHNAVTGIRSRSLLAIRYGYESHCSIIHLNKKKKKKLISYCVIALASSFFGSRKRLFPSFFFSLLRVFVA